MKSFVNIGLLGSLFAVALMAPPDAATGGSIIGDKYKGNYTGAKDWIGELMNEHCYDVPEKGPKTLNVNKVFKLARANHFGDDKLSDLESQVGRKNAEGRIRMTVGNMLRAAARHRHGLNDIDGKWLDAPASFLATSKPKAPEKPDQDHNGNKIVDEAKEAAKAAAKTEREKVAADKAAEKEAAKVAKAATSKAA